jgi:4-hydroxybenzoate polyprenyltransferase
VISVPGDVLVGAAAARWPGGARRAVLSIGASSCLYLAGMALNDYADREVDAVERPGRPIPSGRVTPAFALRLATGLSAAGVALAAAAGGRQGLAVALPLTATVWAYDLQVKSTPAGPAAMASARFFNVLMGAGKGRIRAALPSALVVAAHTAVITTVSRNEVQGATPALGTAALAGSSAVATAASAVALRRSAGAARSAAALGLAGTYLNAQGRAAVAARRDPSPAALQRFVGSGVMGFMPLDAALLSTSAPPSVTAAVAAAWPVARRLARRRSPT